MTGGKAESIVNEQAWPSSHFAVPCTLYLVNIQACPVPFPDLSRLVLPYMPLAWRTRRNDQFDWSIGGRRLVGVCCMANYAPQGGSSSCPLLLLGIRGSAQPGFNANQNRQNRQIGEGSFVLLLACCRGMSPTTAVCVELAAESKKELASLTAHGRCKTRTRSRAGMLALAILPAPCLLRGRGRPVRRFQNDEAAAAT